MKRRTPWLPLLLLVALSACQLPGLTADRPISTPVYPTYAPLPGQPSPTAGQAPVKNAAPQATAAPVSQAQPQGNPGQVYLPSVTGSGSASPEPAQVQSASTPTAPVEPTAAPTATLEPTKPGDIPRLPPYQPHTGSKLTPDKWKQWPVLPVISQRARDIYNAGLQKGNDPRRFSKIGDCQVIRQYFLGYFDDGDQSVRLGSDSSRYQPVLDQFKGSYTRVSMAVRTGFNVASVLSPMNSDPAQCKGGETPLECEFRLWNPSIAIISMETWTANRPTQAYEGYLRQIVDFAISRNVVPILATKADNLEGDHSINAMVARVAYEYDIPLWNFWAATDPLPSHGLEGDGFHLTNGPSILSKAENLQVGWNVRNLTALQTIDLVWRTVSKK